VTETNNEGTRIRVVDVAYYLSSGKNVGDRLIQSGPIGKAVPSPSSHSFILSKSTDIPPHFYLGREQIQSPKRDAVNFILE